MTVSRSRAFRRLDLGWRTALASAVVAGASLTALVWWHTHRVPHGLVRLGVNPTSQYYEILPNGQAEGLAVAVFNEAARRAGIEIRWVPMTVSIDRSLESGEIDIYPVMMPNDRRRSLFHLTRPWLLNRMILLSLADAPYQTLAEVGAGPLAYRSSPGLDESVALAAGDIELMPLVRAPEAMQAICRQEARAMLIEPRFLDRLLLRRPPGCESKQWSIAEVHGINSDVVIGSTRQAAPFADRLSEELASMADDGTLTRQLTESSLFISGETRSLAAIRAAVAESRLLKWGAAACLLLALSLALAFGQILRANREVHRASAAKSKFLANMSHEIRTPMNAVVGMADLLRGMPLSPEAREYAEVIRKSSEALVVILNDILDFSKIEAGRLDLENAPFDLRICLEEMVQVLVPGAREKHLELACDVACDVPRWINGDVTRLRQILLNLAGNAVKFTARGEVIIAVRRSETSGSRTLRFEVRDTGPGIPEDRQRELFRSFSQLDSSTTRRFGGTGLGLAISKQLVRLMGGRIGFDSRVGGGSTFWFEIPEQPAPDQTGPEIAAPAWSGLPALVVDDNSTNRQILAKSLTGWGFAVGEASSGSEAIALIDDAERRHQPQPALVLMDYLMPGMNGVETARELSKRIPDAQMMLVTSVGLPMDELVPPGESNPFQAMLRKPIRSQMLQRALVSLLPPQPQQQPLSLVGPPVEDAADGTLPPRPADRVPPNLPSATSVPAPAFLPLVPAPTPGPAITPLSRQQAEGNAVRILIAEDNVVNQRVVVQLLRRLGFTDTRVVANGKDAVYAVQAEHFDLVFLDLQMPEMDGMQAARIICRQMATGVRPRLVALTANALKGDREACLRAGMDDYLSKPLRLEDLRGALERFLSSAPASRPPPQGLSTPVLDA